MKRGDVCRIRSGALRDTMVTLLYFDEITQAWRVADGGYQMWYRSDELQRVEEVMPEDLDEYLDT